MSISQQRIVIFSVFVSISGTPILCLQYFVVEMEQIVEMILKRTFPIAILWCIETILHFGFTAFVSFSVSV